MSFGQEKGFLWFKSLKLSSHQGNKQIWEKNQTKIKQPRLKHPQIVDLFWQMHFSANYGSFKQYWQMSLGIICKNESILSLQEFTLLPNVIKFWLSSKDEKASFCVGQTEIIILGFMVWGLLQRSLNWGMALEWLQRTVTVWGSVSSSPSEHHCSPQVLFL